MLFAFMAYQGNFSARASAFVDRVLWFRTMNVHFGRVGDIVFAAPETAAPIQSATPRPAKTWLRTAGIAYRYCAANPWVLDEATSHLDVGTERQVLQNLKGLGITIVMSAHRPDAIALADRVFALNTQSWLRG